MADKTNIQWCDHTHNPWRGCTKVSPGCIHCYAETLVVNRMAGQWGRGKPRQRASEKILKDPYRWNKTPWICDACGISYKSIPESCVAFVPDYHGEKLCGGKTFHRARVFLGSLMDIFDPEVKIEWLADALLTVAECQELDFLLVTKRPELWAQRMLDVVAWEHEYRGRPAFADFWLRGNVHKNVWVITSTENQELADKRIPELLKIPAVVHGLSAEPLLGPIDFGGTRLEWLSPFKETDPMMRKTPRIDWVITGGESGPGARQCSTLWIRQIQSQCASADVAYFAKQLGANVIHEKYPLCEREMSNFGRVEDLKLKDKKGGNPSEWPKEMRVREWPQVAR